MQLSTEWKLHKKEIVLDEQDKSNSKCSKQVCFMLNSKLLSLGIRWQVELNVLNKEENAFKSNVLKSYWNVLWGF